MKARTYMYGLINLTDMILYLLLEVHIYYWTRGNPASVSKAACSLFEVLARVLCNNECAVTCANALNLNNQVSHISYLYHRKQPFSHKGQIGMHVILRCSCGGNSKEEQKFVYVHSTQLREARLYHPFDSSGLKWGALTFVYNVKLRQGPTRLFDMGAEACWHGLKRIGDVHSDFKFISLPGTNLDNLNFMTFPSLYSTESIRPLVHRRS